MKRSHLAIFSGCLAIIAASLIITLYLRTSLPDLIPTHFNIIGSPDAWNSKYSIWLYFIPGVNLLIYLLFALIYRYPQYTNWPTTLILMTVEVKKREKIFHVLRAMLAYTLLVITAMFGYLQFVIIAIANNRQEKLSAPVMIVFLAVIFSLIIIVNIRMIITIKRILKEERATSKSL